MKFLKFLFTARMSFVLFALLAFAFTLLYLTWASRGPVRIVRHAPASQSR
jgi:hypothetical protein